MHKSACLLRQIQPTQEELNRLITEIDKRNRKQKVKKQNRKNGVFKRNPTLSWALKKKYRDTCQVCQERLIVENGSFCDTHHIVPLKQGGRDVSENIAVVCPNHHRLLDKCATRKISRTKTKITITTKNQNIIIKLKTKNGKKRRQESVRRSLAKYCE